MAGAITHLLVAEQGFEEAKNAVPELHNTLAGYEPFLLLGAVSPDLPYLDPLDASQSVWADQMHYRRTNLLGMQWAVQIGCANILDRGEGKAELAWVAGYLAHCVTDATIHPIVQAIVGPYHANPTEHRRCEMTQDSLLFTELRGADLRGSEFVDQLKACEPESLRDNILNLWTWPLAMIYPGVQPDPEPRSWYAYYTTLLNGAVDADLLLCLSRVFTGLQDLLYASASTIRAKRPEEATRYYDDIPVPNQVTQRGTFELLGFRRAVANVVQVWQALWTDVLNANRIRDDLKGGALAKVLKNWDLDTGADMDLPDSRVSYWPLT